MGPLSPLLTLVAVHSLVCACSNTRYGLAVSSTQVQSSVQAGCTPCSLADVFRQRQDSGWRARLRGGQRLESSQTLGEVSWNWIGVNQPGMFGWDH